MITPAVKTSWSRARARQVLSSLELKHPCDLDLEDIAWSRGILVKDEDLIGTEGRLVKSGGNGVISVKRGIPEAGRRRFVIAHEIGHFEMHDTENQIDLCAGKDLDYDYHYLRPEEREASLFATELLLPDELVSPVCRRSEISFELARQLSSEFNTTWTLAAMRMIEFTSYRAALVASERGKVKWYRASPNFGYHVPPRAPLDEGTIAADVFASGKCPERGQLVLASSWIKNTRVDEQASMREQCFVLPRYGTILSLIWMEKDIETDD